MSGQSHAYKLLKEFLQLSTSSLPIETRLEEILHSISEAFRPDRCLVVRPDQIGPGGFFSRVASEKKDVWMEEETSIRKGKVLPEEERFLCSALDLPSPLRAGFFSGDPLSRFFKAERFSLRRG